MKNPSLRRRILERITRPLRKRAYNKRRDRTIVSNYKWDRDMPKLDATFNPLADDEHVCFFPPPPVPPKWDDQEQKDKFFGKPNKVEEFLQRVKRDLKKKKQFVNPKTGFLDMRYNPLADDDGCCYFPRRSDPHPSWHNDEERLEVDENHKLDTRYNPLANDEDFFIPVRAA